jgi:hypothetical protein
MSTKYPAGTRPPTPEELHRHLAQFSGTERYYRIHPGLLATDGAKYLADEAGAYWLLDIIWSVLSRITDEFAVFELELSTSLLSSEQCRHLYAFSPSHLSKTPCYASLS